MGDDFAIPVMLQFLFALQFFLRCSFFALQFFLRYGFFCVAVFDALQLLCALPGWVELCEEWVWERLRWVDGPNVKTIWTRDHSIIFVLQFFLHCIFFCVTVFFCVAAFFVLLGFLKL